MRRREYDEHHDHYERHDSYDHCKRHRMSTKVTPSSSGGYAWPHAETPKIVVSPPRSPTPPCDATSPPQVQSPAAPMEVNPNWPPLPPPGEFNQINATMPRLPMIPRHPTLDERNTAYPMIPKGFHRSRVDNTVHVGAAAKAAQWNEALGVVPPHNTMRPSDRGFPQTVVDWEGQQGPSHGSGLRHSGTEHACSATDGAPAPSAEGVDLPGLVHTCAVQGQSTHGAQEERAPACYFVWAFSEQPNRSRRNSCCSRSCPRRTPTADSRTIQRMCGSICPCYGTPLRCGQCGLTRTWTTVHVVLWSCWTAAYQCVAYEGCSLSNSATHDMKLLSNIEHSICSLLLNSSHHPAPIGMPSSGST